MSSPGTEGAAWVRCQTMFQAKGTLVAEAQNGEKAQSVGGTKCRVCAGGGGKGSKGKDYWWGRGGSGHYPIVMQSHRMFYQQGKDTTKMQTRMMAVEAWYQMAWWTRLVARRQGTLWRDDSNYPGRMMIPLPLWRVQVRSEERLGLRNKKGRIASYRMDVRCRVRKECWRASEPKSTLKTDALKTPDCDCSFAVAVTAVLGHLRQILCS